MIKLRGIRCGGTLILMLMIISLALGSCGSTTVKPQSAIGTDVEDPDFARIELPELELFRAGDFEKLLQKAKKSTIPNVPDLESFFSRLEKKLKKLDRKADYAKYMKVVKENAREIREKVLKYLMVRRTRTEIEKYFKQDIQQQGLKFPKVNKPEPLFYELNDEEDNIFSKTINLIAHQFKYARYTPLLYFTGDVDQLELQSQRNMGRFMKILLVKRLESSFFAFKNSIDRFLHSYEMFLREFKNGYVYISKKYAGKIFEFLENDNAYNRWQTMFNGKLSIENKHKRQHRRTDIIGKSLDTGSDGIPAGYTRRGKGRQPYRWGIISQDTEVKNKQMHRDERHNQARHSNRCRTEHNFNR